MGKGPLVESVPETDSTSGQAVSSCQLYRLMLVDEETGQPQRAATESEAELVARSLHKDASNACLPCLRAVSESVSTGSDSDSGTPRYVGHLAKHGGPCQHCGTSAVGLNLSRCRRMAAASNIACGGVFGPQHSDGSNDPFGSAL